MKTALLTRARKHFCSPDLPRESNRAHIRKWIASLRILGDSWVLSPTRFQSREAK